MIQREKKRENLIQKYRVKRLNLKGEIKADLPYGDKIQVYQKLQELPKNSSPCRKRNRCWQTGRSRALRLLVKCDLLVETVGILYHRR